MPIVPASVKETMAQDMCSRPPSSPATVARDEATMVWSSAPSRDTRTFASAAGITGEGQRPVLPDPGRQAPSAGPAQLCLVSANHGEGRDTGPAGPSQTGPAAGPAQLCLVSANRGERPDAGPAGP